MTILDSSLQNKRGNVTLVFALSSFALLGAVGGTVEVTRIVGTKAEIQSSVDAAALAAVNATALLSVAKKGDLAVAAFLANLGQVPGMVDGSAIVIPDFTIPGEATVTATITIESIMGKGVFGATHTISATATAAGAASVPVVAPVCPAAPTPTDVPLQAPPPPPPAAPAGPAGKGCIWGVDGSVGAVVTGFFNAPTCDIHANDLGVVSVGTIAINKIFAGNQAGGVTSSSPGPFPWAVSNAGALLQGDPFPTGLPQPTGLCDHTNFTRVGFSRVVVNPGVYCGDTSFVVSGDDVEFRPGLYIFRGGVLAASARSLFARNGVTMFFDNAKVGFALSGKFHVEAPTTGPYAGLAMYEKYGSKADKVGLALSNAGGSIFSGLVYFPSKPIGIAASGTTSTQRFLMVGKTVSFAGTNWNIEPSTIFPSGVAPLAAPVPVVPPPPPPPVSTATNLLPNGSFEAPVIPTGGNLYASALPTIPDWTTTNAFEYWNSRFDATGGGFGTDGVQYAELTGNLSQTVPTSAGRTYEVSFDYRYGNDGAVLDNRIEVLWDGDVIGTVDPKTPTATPTEWQRIVFAVKGTKASTIFTLRQVATANWSDGASIDRVRIFENNGLAAPAPGCPGGGAAPAQAASTPIRLTWRGSTLKSKNPS